MVDDIREELKESFTDKEYRQAYASSFLNTSIAAQIKALRDANGWSQEELGKRAGGMRQESISRLENVNYSSWSISTLRRLAEAFDLALTVKFESFGHLLDDIASLTRETLVRDSFANDPSFTNKTQAKIVDMAEYRERRFGVEISSKASNTLMPPNALEEGNG